MQYKDVIEKIGSINSSISSLQWLLYSFIGATISQLVGLAVFIWNVNKDVRKDTSEEIKRIYDRIDKIFIAISEERGELLDEIDILDRAIDIRIDKALAAEKEAREKDVANIIRTCDGCKK